MAPGAIGAVGRDVREEVIAIDTGEAKRVDEAQDAAVQRLRMRRNHREAVEVVAGLRNRGIGAVLLKGAAVHGLLYGTEVRPTSDVDLLVAPREVRSAGRALASMGYVTFARSGHATSWEAPGHIPVDLHRTIPRSEVSAHRVWRILADHQVATVVEGAEVTVLDPAAMAVHLAIHLTQTASDRQLDDLGRAVAQLSDEDWRAAASIAGGMGTSSSLAWALDQVPGGRARREDLGLPPTERGALPVRKPFEAGIVRFVTSPVHWRERVGALRRSAVRSASQQSLAAWASERGRPVPSTFTARVGTFGARSRDYLARGRRSG